MYYLRDSYIYMRFQGGVIHGQVVCYERNSPRLEASFVYGVRQDTFIEYTQPLIDGPRIHKFSNRNERWHGVHLHKIK